MEHILLQKPRIFCIWSGENEMSDNRKRCLDSIYRNCGCDVILLNKSNLNKYIVDNHPIHEGYEYLSLTHKADYLRAYIMYHHGGGYTDIKMNNFNWINYFNRLYFDDDKQFIGYAEKCPDHIASNVENIRYSFYMLPGVVHFIFKRHAEISNMWLRAVNSILDNKLYDLKTYPGHYHPRAIYGGAQGTSLFQDSKYPLRWNEILGSIFHKVAYDNIGKYILNMPYPNTLNYI